MSCFFLSVTAILSPDKMNFFTLSRWQGSIKNKTFKTMFGISLKQIAVTVLCMLVAFFIYDFVSAKLGMYEEE